MATGVDLGGFLDRAVIHPDDGVALRLAGRRNGERAAGVVERDQRTSSVEADPGDVAAGRRRRFAHRSAGRRPNVGRGMFDDFAGLAEDGDRAAGAGDQPACGVEYAGARARRADIDADEKPAHSNPASQPRELSGAGAALASGVSARKL